MRERNQWRGRKEGARPHNAELMQTPATGGDREGKKRLECQRYLRATGGKWVGDGVLAALGSWQEAATSDV